jgi:hypothetical protein
MSASVETRDPWLDGGEEYMVSEGKLANIYPVFETAALTPSVDDTHVLTRDRVIRTWKFDIRDHFRKSRQVVRLNLDLRILGRAMARAAAPGEHRHESSLRYISVSVWIQIKTTNVCLVVQLSWFLLESVKRL